MTFATKFFANFTTRAGAPRRNRRRERTALLSLDEHLLRDLGLTRSDVRHSTGGLR